MTLDVRQLPATMRWLSEPDDGREVFDPSRDGLHQTMLFMPMLVGIGHITEETVNSFYFRVSFYERLFGTFLVQAVDNSDLPEDENGVRPLRMRPRPIRLEDVRKFIGFRVNVFPEVPPAAQFERNDEYFYTMQELAETGSIPLHRLYEEDSYKVDEYGDQLLPVTPVSGSDTEYALRIFNRFVAEGEYQLRKRLEAGLLSCGCPEQIVADEGHQEGCETRSPAR